MTTTEKPRGGQPESPEAQDRAYYVPHLKEYRSAKDLTQEDRESMADNLFGPSESEARDELIRQMKKLARSVYQAPTTG